MTPRRWFFPSLLEGGPDRRVGLGWLAAVCRRLDGPKVLRMDDLPEWLLHDIGFKDGRDLSARQADVRSRLIHPH